MIAGIMPVQQQMAFFNPVGQLFFDFQAVTAILLLRHRPQGQADTGRGEVLVQQLQPVAGIPGAFVFQQQCMAAQTAQDQHIAVVDVDVVIPHAGEIAILNLQIPLAADDMDAVAVGGNMPPGAGTNADNLSVEENMAALAVDHMGHAPGAVNAVVLQGDMPGILDEKGGAPALAKMPDQIKGAGPYGFHPFGGAAKPYPVIRLASPQDAEFLRMHPDFRIAGYSGSQPNGIKGIERADIEIQGRMIVVQKFQFQVKILPGYYPGQAGRTEDVPIHIQGEVLQQHLPAILHHEEIRGFGDQFRAAAVQGEVFPVPDGEKICVFDAVYAGSQPEYAGVRFPAMLDGTGQGGRVVLIGRGKAEVRRVHGCLVPQVWGYNRDLRHIRFLRSS